MNLKLSDLEKVALKHALERYSVELKGRTDDKGLEYELDAVRCVLEKMDEVSAAPGI